MVEFTQEIFDDICDRIADGQSVKDVCGNNEDMPNPRTFFRWIEADEALRHQYARAKDAMADALFDDCLSIADQYDSLAEKLDTDHIQRAKLRIDTRKWMAGRLSPKKYGDKLALHGDKTLDPIQSERIPPAEILKARLAAIRSRTDGAIDADAD